MEEEVDWKELQELLWWMFYNHGLKASELLFEGETK